MSDQPDYASVPEPVLSSPLHSEKRSGGETGADGSRDYRSGSRVPPSFGATDVGETNEAAPWSGFPVLLSRQPHALQDTQLPTPQSYGADNMFPFFPTAVSSPESPLAYARLRTSGGSSGASLVPRVQACGESWDRKDSIAEPQAITPRASPVVLPTSLPARPLPLPISSSQERPVCVKTESPPPVLELAHDALNDLAPQAVPGELQTADTSLSSPFVERPRTDFNSTRLDESFHLQPSHSTSTSILTQPITLSSPAHITERKSLPNKVPNILQISTGEPSRQPGGELNRIRNHLLEVQGIRRAELESLRPDYLKRIQHVDDIGPSDRKPVDSSTEKDNIVIMETPARGRRLQLFDFQETSAESFEESLMTHGYGTYGEPRTPHRPLATEMLSKEARDWLAYNTPAAVPSSSHPHLVPDVELNEKELKKRKRLEAFKGSAARAYAKLYPAEVEGLGRILLNVPPEEVDELVGSPAKKRATGKKRRGAAAAEKKNRMQLRSTPMRIEGTEPRWLDKEVPWCLREKEREEEMRVQDAERMRWIDNYFAHDTTDDDSDRNEEDRTSPAREQETDEPVDVSRGGRGKMVPLQANPNRREGPNDSKKGRSLFFPTDPADARTALMSKRNVRLLAHRKMRRNGQRPASLRGYGDGKLACACGQVEDDGRPAVQCDDCYNWHHLECIGVQDERELGEEEDPWFCAACTAQSKAVATDWHNRPQPTFVPTDERPVHSTTKSDVAFYSSSPLRDWGSSGSLHTPLQGQGRLDGGSSGSSRRSIWDDPHSVAGPSTPLTAAPGVQVHTSGTFDPMISPRSSFPRFGASFTTPKNMINTGATGSTGFGNLLWPPQSSSGLFTTPTARGRGSSDFGFNYGSDGPISARAADAMYAPDDTPIRRAPTKETRALGLSAYSSTASFVDSPLAGRGSQPSTVLDGKRETLRASVD